jgi:drug/metabolite transporter (DMT)-like permease
MLPAGEAVAAAIAINAGYVVQHGGLSSAPRIELRRPLAAVAGLLRSPRWIVGATLGYVGLALEIVALTTLPLSTVQATIGAGLFFVAALSRAVGKARLGRAAPLGAALAIGALAILAVVTPAAAVAPSPRPSALAAAAIIVAGAAALAATRLPSATGLALAAGLLYGMTSIAMAALAPALAGTAPAVGVVAAAVPIGGLLTVGGFLSFQRALQHGQPLPVVTVMMAAMDVVAIAGGILLLGDPLAADPGARVAQLGALALTAVSAVVVLGGRRREPSIAPEAPGLVRGADAEPRPGIGRDGARPGVGPHPAER